MADRPTWVGIDLGTTNSTAAVFDGEQIALVRNAQGSPLTPSVVRIDAKGVVTVGARARRFLDTDPENTRGEFKRLMGTRTELEFEASKQKKLPEQLAAEVLRSLRADVQEQLGFLPERAVVAVPALFELPQSGATSEAARLAGFERVELLQEPVASALAAGWKAEDDGGGAWLVYDLGGGTFDASLLETRDGLLRVVGHDGDNFLGGRDIDRAIVGWIAEKTGAVDPSDPAHAAAFRRLRLAAEDAKVDLTRATETTVVVPDLAVDVVLDRATLDALVAPIVERSVEICLRLLATHGLVPPQLSRVVLVGGPTVMPALRERVARALGARFSEGLDPMTLVAQGAALYAATAGLDARPKPKTAVGRRLWLQYPAMSSDLTPHVVGRLLPGAGVAPTEVRLAREGWETGWIRLDREGGLVVAVELVPRRPNLFTVEGRDAEGNAVPVDPPSIAIVQGMTISDPPLSRTIGVALASDRVHTYLERGTPLPAKRTFQHQTVDSVARGLDDCVLRIPIVQGEFETAHLCRLVGTLEIGGRVLEATLPAGSDVEVTIEVDRGGRLQARALVPATGQVFEQVARLVVPDAAPETLAENLGELRRRIGLLRQKARDARALDRLFDVEWKLSDAEADVDAARAGDADAAQKARRTLIEADAALDEVETLQVWPELEDEARRTVASASKWVAMYGTPEEERLLAETSKSIERAREARQPVELQRQLRLARELATAAWYRDPTAWQTQFEWAAADVSRSRDPAQAQALVRDGRAAIARNDQGALRGVVQQLWALLPPDTSGKRQGHDSGLR